MPRNEPEMKTIDRDEAWDLIPWYVNGTLDAREAAAVEAYLTEDPSFRAEVAAERRLAEGVAALDTMDVEMERSLRAMRQRIEAETPMPRPRAEAGGVRRALAGLAKLDLRLLFPVGAVTAAVALLLVVLQPAPVPDARFQTLTDPATVSEVPQIRIKVSGEATETGLRRLFLQHDVRVVDGPTPTGVYTLETAPGADAQAIAAALLASSDVEFAAVRQAP